jgi:hypothetical protein
MAFIDASVTHRGEQDCGSRLPKRQCRREHAPHEGATGQAVDTASHEHWTNPRVHAQSRCESQGLRHKMTGAPQVHALQARAQSNTTVQGSSSFVPGSRGLFRSLNPMTEAHTKRGVHPAFQVLTPETPGWPTQQQQLLRQAASSSVGGLTDASTTILAPIDALSSGAPARAPRKRAILDSEAVIRIFSSRHDTSTCNVWATEQGVTTKTIRDIWNLRTWRQ